MHKYLRDLLDVADLVGDVEDIVFMDWSRNNKMLRIEGKQANGKPFKLCLECEVEKDAD